MQFTECKDWKDDSDSQFWIRSCPWCGAGSSQDQREITKEQYEAWINQPASQNDFYAAIGAVLGAVISIVIFIAFHLWLLSLVGITF